MLIVRCVCPCNSVFPLSHTLLLFLSISISRTRTHQALLGTCRNERTGQVDYEKFLQQMEGDNRFHRTSQHMFQDRGFATGTNLLENVKTLDARRRRGFSPAAAARHQGRSQPGREKNWGVRARSKRRGFSPGAAARHSQYARVQIFCPKTLFFQFFDLSLSKTLSPPLF